MLARVIVLGLLVPATAVAQGFAGLGSDAGGFALPDPDHVLSFPADHGPHPDFRIEWWYLTATLDGADGRDYGVQWTLFRAALAPGEAGGWDSPQIWFGHAGLTTPTRHFHAEKLARGGIGQAGVQAAPFSAHIDDWVMQSNGGTGISALSLSAHGDGFGYDLMLDAGDRPLVLHGDGGYSVKSRDGQASHYYSQPFYRISGTLQLPDGTVKVTGDGWFDREWSSQPLSASQEGWDWFSLSFDSGDKLMGFRLRGNGDFTSATWIAPDGQATALPDGALIVAPLERSKVAGREIPTAWTLRLPARGVDVEVTALNPHSWMDTSFAYWEGPVRVAGSHKGRGYLEMTGY
nr:lipocalin-like domain-containing protein [Pukyongiella litopenaei]